MEYQKRREKQKRADIIVVRFASVLQIVGGAACYVASIVTLVTHQVPSNMLIRWLFAFIGPFSIFLGFFVWRLRKWALIGGLIMYTAAFIGNLYVWPGPADIFMTIRVFTPLIFAFSFGRLVFLER